MKIYCVTHKVLSFVPSERTLIGVGNRKIDGVEQYDSSDDNISAKNTNYCELTALYWIWKNANDEIVGLEHYRRFFCANFLLKTTPLSLGQLKKYFAKYDAVLPRVEYTRIGNYNFYKKEHDIQDMELCRQSIATYFPDYLESFDFVMSQKFACPYNMFVMKKELLNSYCEWLFTILFNIESKVDLDSKDEYQKRVFGFLSERLFNVWLHYNKLKVKYCNVFMLNDFPLKIKLKQLIKKILLKLKLY